MPIVHQNPVRHLPSIPKDRLKLLAFWNGFRARIDTNPNPETQLETSMRESLPHPCDSLPPDTYNSEKFTLTTDHGKFKMQYYCSKRVQYASCLGTLCPSNGKTP